MLSELRGFDERAQLLGIDGSDNNACKAFVLIAQRPGNLNRPFAGGSSQDRGRNIHPVALAGGKVSEVIAIAEIQTRTIIVRGCIHHVAVSSDQAELENASRA